MYFGNAYVAFLDILGFKEIIKSNNLSEVANLLCSINDCVKDASIGLGYATEKTDSKSKYALHNKCLLKSRIISMSDSIVVVVPAFNRYALACIINICERIQSELLVVSDKPILIRGAITKGEIYTDGSIVCGKALVDAYLAEENLSIYPRIILSEEVIESGFCYVVRNQELYKINQDEDGFHYIDIYASIYDNASVVNRLYKLIRDNMKSYSESGVRQKYIWLQRKLNELDILQ